MSRQKKIRIKNAFPYLLMLSSRLIAFVCFFFVPVDFCIIASHNLGLFNKHSVVKEGREKLKIADH